MKIFLTGGTGVVGTRAVPALVAAGHDVTAVARGEAKAELVRTMGAAPVVVDLFDADAVRAAVVGHEVVVHLATNIPPLTKASGKQAWTMNDRLRREASGHLIAAATATGAARYVQESICFPYVDAGDRWIDEAAPIDHTPDAFAGAAVAEAATAAFTAAGGTGVVLRFGQFYAADSTHTRSFNRAVRWHVNPFVGAPDAYSTFVHAEDAGSSVVAALSAPPGIYNVTDDEPLTRVQAGCAVAEALGIRRPLTLPRWMQAMAPASAKPLTRSLRVSNASFKDSTGWAPAHPSIRGSWPGKADT
jgi:nucleoside-diphosphate-sugar epimerase